MKQLIIKSTLTLSLLILVGCNGSSPTAPSQNKALNNISNSNGKDKSGFMQHALDSWTKNDWEPKTVANPEIQKKYMVVDEKATAAQTGENKKVIYKEKENRSFTLQELVDKSAAYLEATPSDGSESNAKKMETLPVIGKK